MKIIQEYFKKANKDELIRSYLFKHPITIKSDTDFDSDGTDLPNISMKDTWDFSYRRVEKLINKIISTKIERKDDEEYIFFAHHLADIVCDFDDICFSLVKKSELLDENVETVAYAYELTHLKETAGYFVADTYLTQYEIEELLLDYLYESSFFGYDQEYIDETNESLAKSAKEVEEHKNDPSYFKPIETLFEELDIELEKRDKMEKELYNKLLKKVAEYNKKAFKIEEKKLIETLKT